MAWRRRTGCTSIKHLPPLSVEVDTCMSHNSKNSRDAMHAIGYYAVAKCLSIRLVRPSVMIQYCVVVKFLNELVDLSS